MATIDAVIGRLCNSRDIRRETVLEPLGGVLVEFWRSGGARDRILQSLFILALTWLISKLAMALFAAIESRQAIKQVPNLLKNIIVVSIFALAIFLILAWIYEVPPSSLVAHPGSPA